jgi:hypothetical protein
VVIQKPASPDDLVAAVISRLKAFRTEVWTQNFAGLGIPIDVFFSLVHMKRIATDCCTIDTDSDLRTVLGTKYFLDSSFLQPYTQTILKIIIDTRSALQHSCFPNVSSAQQQVDHAQGPQPRKKRKYDVPFTPEDHLDPSNPSDQRTLRRQRELQQYDQHLVEKKAAREKASQQAKAAQTVFDRTQKADTRKQKSIREGTSRTTQTGEHR